MAKAVHRCSATGFFGPRQRLVYTAQTRQKAREKWEQDFVPDLEASRAFRRRFHPSWANGNEHLRFANGSRWGLEAATEKAGHGGTIDEAYLDEAFAHQDFRLEQAFGPAMITRVNKLLAWISHGGVAGRVAVPGDEGEGGQGGGRGGPPVGAGVFRVVGPAGRGPG